MPSKELRTIRTRLMLPALALAAIGCFFEVCSLLFLWFSAYGWQVFTLCLSYNLCLFVCVSVLEKENIFPSDERSDGEGKWLFHSSVKWQSDIVRQLPCKLLWFIQVVKRSGSNLPASCYIAMEQRNRTNWKLYSKTKIDPLKKYERPDSWSQTTYCINFKTPNTWPKPCGLYTSL